MPEASVHKYRDFLPDERRLETNVLASLNFCRRQTYTEENVELSIKFLDDQETI